MDIDGVIGRVRAGECRAYDELVRAFQGPLRAYVAAFYPDPGQVDDIAQKCFVWAYEHLDRYEPGTRFYVWLKAIARNTVLAELEILRREAQRKKKYIRYLQVVHGQEELSREGGEIELAERLRDCLQSLPDHSRRLILRRYEGRASVESIAREERRDLNAVTVALFRIRQALRRCVELKGTGPAALPQQT